MRKERKGEVKRKRKDCKYWRRINGETRREERRLGETKLQLNKE